MDPIGVLQSIIVLLGAEFGSILGDISSYMYVRCSQGLVLFSLWLVITDDEGFTGFGAVLILDTRQDIGLVTDFGLHQVLQIVLSSLLSFHSLLWNCVVLVSFRNVGIVRF